MSDEQDSIIGQLLNPVIRCLTPEVARRIVALRASENMKLRVDRLADKANAGSLLDSERSEYEQFIRFSQFITLLQIKARDLLDESSETG